MIVKIHYTCEFANRQAYIQNQVIGYFCTFFQKQIGSR